MSTRATLTVAFAALVLLAGVGPVVAGPAAPAADSAATADSVPAADSADSEVEHMNEAPIQRTGDAVFQYKVSLNNVTINTWLIRNSTVLNATVEQVVVRNATTENGSRQNVTLTNVTVGTFAIERGRLENVTAQKLVVRNKSVLSIPGGDFIDPNVKNRTIERHWTKNETVAGVVVDQMTVDAAVLCENATLGQRAPEDASFDPQTGDEKPAITVQNGTVAEALVIRGQATNWSVGNVQQTQPTNTSLPTACNRG